MPLDLHPIDAAFGREVRGLNLLDLDQAGAETIRKTLLEHALLLFRGQCLHDQDLDRISALMGRVETAANARTASPEYPKVIYLTNMKDQAGQDLGGLGAGDVTWHSDQYFRDTPATLSILFAVLPPPRGGTTHWCNIRLGYEAVPEDLKPRIEGLRGIYGTPPAATVRHKDVSHPVVLKHPISDRRSLYVHLRTKGIEGMPDGDAKPLIEDLLACNLREENYYHHPWRMGDLIMYDNGQNLHSRDAFDGPRFMKCTRVFLPADRFPALD